MKVVKDWKKTLISCLAILAVIAIGFIVAINNQKTKISINEQEMRRMQSYAQITEDDEYVDANKRVAFSAFFARDLNGDGYTEKILGTCNKVDVADTMYINIGVNTEGHLEDGVISIQPQGGQSNKNYTYEMSMLADDVLAHNCVSYDIGSISLNEIDAGMSKVLSGVIRSKITTEDSYCGVVQVTLTGNYFDDEGNRTPINKTFELNIDWYGTATTTINGSSLSRDWKSVGENSQIPIQCRYNVTTKGLLVQEQYVEVSAPELFGYYPERVSYSEQEGIEYNYDESNHKLNIIYTTSGKEVSGDVVFVYPKEIYDSVKNNLNRYASYKVYIPISAYAKCYNNPNEEFQNPYLTQKVYTNSVYSFSGNEKVDAEFLANMELMDTKFLGYNASNVMEYGWCKNEILELYDLENGQKYNFRVKGTTTRAKTESGVTTITVHNGDVVADVVGDGWYEKIAGENLSEENGIFVVDGQDGKQIKVHHRCTPKKIYQNFYENKFDRYSADDCTFVESVAFTNTSAIKYDGYIRIIDGETDEIIKEFTNGQWLLYGESNPYMLENPVSKIKIETSEDDSRKNGTLETIVAEYIDIDMMKNSISRDQLKNIIEFDTSVIFTNGNVLNVSDKALMYDDVSYTEVTATPNKVSLNGEELPITFTITASDNIEITNNAKQPTKWVDGIFLVRISKDSVSKLDINNITTGNQKVVVDRYSINEDEDYYYIKVYTKNTDTKTFQIGDEIITEPKEENVNINIEGNIIVNPFLESQSVLIDVYSYNKFNEMYNSEVADIYDLDNDGSVQDYVGYCRCSIGAVIDANSIRAGQSLTNYSDNQNDKEISAPNVAQVKTSRRTATVNVRYINDNNNSVADFKLLGKIPFEGNKDINGNDLKSKYSVTMTPDGVTGMEEITTVYYTENENPTTNLDDESNAWKVKNDVTDFSKVKCYLVVANEGAAIEKNRLCSISYNINIPEGIEENKTSYASVVLSYDLYTTGGLLPIQNQPRKLGIRIVEFYDMNIKKLKAGSERPIQSAVFSLVEEDDDPDDDIVPKPQQLTSDNGGNIIKNDLRVNQIYTLEEISGGNCETRVGFIKFRVIKDSNQNLSIEVLQESTSNFDGAVTFIKDASNKNIMTSIIYNEPKVVISLHKIDSGSKSPMKDVRFIVSGDNESKAYKTGADGVVDILLTANKEYTIKEIAPEGYYPINPFTVKVLKTSNGYEVQSSNNAFSQIELVNGNDSDYVTGSVTIENESIPTYNLKIVKIDKDKKTPIEGVKFSLYKEDLRKSEILTTNENGIANSANLYEYVEGKDVTGRYTLREISGKDGYILNEEQIKFYITRDVEGNIEAHIENEDSLETLYDVGTDKQTLTLTISNQPLFKLLKINSKTKEPLANVGFKLYSLDDNGNEVDFAKDVYGEYIGTKNEKDEYIIMTDENGEIYASLPAGSYKIVEAIFLEGYDRSAKEEIFTIKSNEDPEEIEIDDGQGEGNGNQSGSGSSGSTETEIKELHIDSIEDLLTFRNNARTYTSVYLDCDLDFNDDSSYEDPNSTSYRDLNKNGIIEPLKEELTNRESGEGFGGIQSFEGVFEGQNHKIENLYINRNSTNSSDYRIAFILWNRGTIRNFGLSGTIIASGRFSDIGSIDASDYWNASNLENCYSDVDITVTADYTNIKVQGVGYSAKNSYYAGNITVNTAADARSVSIYGVAEHCDSCYNIGKITLNSQSNETKNIYAIGGEYIINCYNRADIEIRGNSSNLNITTAGVSYKTTNCYTTGKVIINGVTYNGTGSQYYLHDSQYGDYSGGSTCARTDEYMKSDDFIRDLSEAYWQKDTENVNDGYPILKSEQNLIYEINSIEDLIRFSSIINAVSTYTTQAYENKIYEGEIVTLNKDLNFYDDSSYDDPTSTHFGDINGDGIVEGIKQELTNVNGKGFLMLKKTFYGQFEGNNHTISNLYINVENEKYVGLFGSLGNKGSISNLSVEGTIKAKNCTNVGMVCSYRGLLTNVHTSGSIDADWCTNIAGVGGNSVKNCSSSVNIDVRDSNDNSTNTYVAGVCIGVTSFSYNTGNITVTDNAITNLKIYGVGESSLFGYNTGNIEVDVQAASSAEVFGIGRSAKYGYNRGNIDVNVNLSGTTNVYGLGATAINSYNAGNLEFTGSATTLNVDATCATSYNSYFRNDTTITGTTMTKGIGKTSAYMKQDDFVSDIKERYWTQDASQNDGYPIFKSKDNILITDLNYIEDLVTIGQDVLNELDYEGVENKLARTLDFNESSSYRDSTDTSFGDINGDGTVSDIKTELTTGQGWLPIGLSSTYVYKGSFDGQNYEIRNLHMARNSNFSGLFGYVDNATIKNVTITGTIEAYQTYVGGICGYAVQDITIENCINKCTFTDGNTSSKYEVGGILGNYVGSGLSIKSCENYGDMSGNFSNVAGIVGYTNGIVSIIDCTNHGNISSTDSQVGGIIGYDYEGQASLVNCINNGNISSTGNWVGGIVGEDSSSTLIFIDCVNNGDVKGSGYVSGILGYTFGGSSSSNNCANNGNIECENDYMAGFSTGGHYSINNFKNTGNLTFTGSYADFIGGIIAYGSGTISNSSNTGNISANRAQYVGGIAGVSDSCQIENTYNTGNITVTSCNYISGITTNGGTCKNCYNTGNITVSASNRSVYCAGILGYDGTAINCYNTGNINIINESSSYNEVAGIVRGSGTIVNCYNTGNINVSSEGEARVGGILSSSGTVTDCYNEGDINVISPSYIYAGGIGNSGGANNCYNTGDITISNYTSYTYVAGIFASGGNVNHSYNLGAISANGTGYIYAGGISGSNGGNVQNSYNKASIYASGNGGYVGGIIGTGSAGPLSYNTGNVTGEGVECVGGIIGSGNADKCGNTGKVTCQGNYSSVCVGGVSGRGTVTISYNKGNVENTAVGGGTVSVGGIAGYGKVVNAYNWGNVLSDTSISMVDKLYVGGIAGQLYSESAYVYNIGDVTNRVSGTNTSTEIYTGPLGGSIYSGDAMYYSEDILVDGPNKNHNEYAFIGNEVSDEYLRSNELYEILKPGAEDDWKHHDSQYSIFELPLYIAGTDTQTEIKIENDELTYNVTGEVIGGTGGTINESSGSNIKIEEIPYGHDSTKDIVIEPSEGYTIEYVKINGEGYAYELQENQTIIPAGYFTDVKRHNRVEVKFALINDLVTINKEGPDGEKLSGAEFSINQLESRPEPSQSIIGEMTGANTYTNPDFDKPANETLGPVIANGTYYFEEQSDGTYISNNHAKSTTAVSYFKVDLTGREGTNYRAVINATGCSTYRYDEGNFYTGTSTDKSQASYFGYIYGNETKNITSNKLEGGNIYYIFMTFDMSNSSSTDLTGYLQINSINVYEEKYEEYGFVEKNGKYVSTNQGQSNRDCRSNLEIDLTGLTGKYKIVVNAELSSNGINRGYVQLYNGSSWNTFIDLKGEIPAADYSAIVDGGTICKLYFTYAKGDSDAGNSQDKFTINSIRVELDDSDFYREEGATSNSEGQILRSLPYGTYKITETKAPEGYEISEEPKTIVVGENTDNSVTFVDQKKKEVVAHYYVAGTGEEYGNDAIRIEADKYMYGYSGSPYVTRPILQLKPYRLVKDNNGNPVIPSNASGQFGINPETGESVDTTNVYYYYEADIPIGSFDLQMTKVDELDEQIPIEGAEFDVYKFDLFTMEKIATLEGRGEGLYSTGNIPITEEGELKLVIKETVTPEGYKPVEDIYMTLTIELDTETNTYKVVNTDYGYIDNRDAEEYENIIKGTIDEPLEEYAYEVHYYDENNQELVDLAETNLKALYRSKITEYPNKTPKGYKLRYAKALNVGGQEVDLPLIIKTDESKNRINVYYDKIMGSYKLYATKVNEDDNTIKVEGAEFEVFDVTGTNEVKIATLTDKGNGSYETESIDITEEKTINVEIRETVVPAGYQAVGPIRGTITFEFDEDEGVYKITQTNLGGIVTATEENTENGIIFTIEEPYDSFGYTIEYYYDNVKDASKTVSGTAKFGSRINTYEDKVIDGYKLDREENKPMTITSNTANNVMKVFYVKDTFGYSIEYYYDNVKNDDKTVTGTALFGTVINEYVDKNIDGYKLDREENKPMTITSTAANNVMKIYYVKDSFNYEVHYFYENGENTYAEDESKAELTNSAVFGSEISTYTQKLKPGFKYEKARALNAEGTEGEMPLLIKSDESKNKINVYYIKDALGYEIHYFYEDLNGEYQEDASKQENKNATIGEEISAYPDKSGEGFELDREKALDENGEETDLPLIIKADATKNIINVYYRRSNFDYTVHYFIDGVENESLVETGNAKFGSSISTYTEKCPDGYEKVKARALDNNSEEVELPLIIKADVTKNRINVYYQKIVIPQGKVYVEYIDNLTEEKINVSGIDNPLVMSGDIGSNYETTRITIPGYILDEDNLPTNETGTYKTEDQTVTYKYIKLRPYELLVKYTAGEDEIDDAKIAVEFGEVDDEGNQEHRIEGYTTNGILKVADIELTDLKTENYTVYETETPEYCKTIVSKENPGIVELKGILNAEQNKYEYVATYDEKEGFKVVIDEENKKVIIEITTKKEEKYDLAVKKFITNIGGNAITDREPKAIVSEDGKVTYSTNDRIEKTANNQNITYTIRMYNESQVKAKGKRVIEYVPDGLVFVPENEINTKYGWGMFKADENGKLIKTENAEEAVIVATDYLVGKDIEALHIADKTDEQDESKVSSLDVEVLFRVDESRITSEDRIIENKVQIMPNKNDDNTENDETSEKVYVQFFDLDIEKYIETVKIENKAGTEERKYGYDRRGELVKIDVKKSLVNSTKITVTYGLLIKNVGEIAGYATEIEDIMPEGFKLVEDGNWTIDGNRAVTTSLGKTILQPEESTVLNITFEWELTEDTIGLKSNEAHIAKYENEFDAKDLTEDNRGKQDILVTIKTGTQAITSMTLALASIMIMAIGVALIRKNKI